MHEQALSDVIELAYAQHEGKALSDAIELANAQHEAGFPLNPRYWFIDEAVQAEREAFDDLEAAELVLKIESERPAALRAEPKGVALNDFVAYMPSHSYICKPTREMWPASSVNSRIPPVEVAGREKPMPVNMWLDQNSAVYPTENNHKTNGAAHAHEPQHF